MEMALLIRYAPQLPLWIRDSARARGGLLVTHGDCHPRQDNRQGVLLRRRFRASAANSAAAARGAGSSTAKKNLLLQHSPRAKPRLLCSPFEYIMEEREEGPENGTVSFAVARNRLQEALLAANGREQMLDALGFLKLFAGDKDYYDVEYKATDLLLTAVSPLAYLSSGGAGKHGGSGGGGLDLDDDVVKESLAVACLLLRNAPAKISTTLWSEISLEKGLKTSLERIRDSGGSGRSARDEAGKLADEILTQLPSTPN